MRCRSKDAQVRGQMGQKLPRTPQPSTLKEVIHNPFKHWYLLEISAYLHHHDAEL
jgi:hypothetical protein